jgi:hypothetical protein
MMKIISLLSCLPSVWSHAFMTVPASRNLNQCISAGKDGLPVLEALNNCLAVQDRSGILGACRGLPCIGCWKFSGMIINAGGHHTCTPGNHPGTWKIRKNVCGVWNMDPLFVLPAVGPEFAKDDPQVTWQAGTVVDVEVKYMLNHAGNYQFRLCLDGSDTDECFNETPLKFEDGQDWHWIDAGWLVTSMLLPSFSFKGKHMKDRIVIPDWIECEHCTLNWRWDCALEASVFSNCADVTILPARPGPGPARTTPRPDPRPEIFNLVTHDGLCLDIPGSNMASGQPLWIWECGEADNQQFIFAEDSWRITSASDPSLCVDAGSMSVGNQISLSECTGEDQQAFGYDDDSGTIFLANSGSDASLCLKPEGAENAAAVTVAACDNQDEAQEWGFSSSTFMNLHAFSNQTLAEWI